MRPKRRLHAIGVSAAALEAAAERSDVDAFEAEDEPIG